MDMHSRQHVQYYVKQQIHIILVFTSAEINNKLTQTKVYNSERSIRIIEKSGLAAMAYI